MKENKKLTQLRQRLCDTLLNSTRPTRNSNYAPVNPLLSTLPRLRSKYQDSFEACIFKYMMEIEASLFFYPRNSIEREAIVAFAEECNLDKICMSLTKPKRDIIAELKPLLVIMFVMARKYNVPNSEIYSTYTVHLPTIIMMAGDHNKMKHAELETYVNLTLRPRALASGTTPN